VAIASDILMSDTPVKTPDARAPYSLMARQVIDEFLEEIKPTEDFLQIDQEETEG